MRNVKKKQQQKFACCFGGLQGRSVTILASTHTGPYGLKNVVQNNVCFPLIHISAVYRLVYNKT